MPVQHPDHLHNVAPALELYLSNLRAMCEYRIAVHSKFDLILVMGSKEGQVKIIAETSARLCSMLGNNGVCVLVILVGASQDYRKVILEGETKIPMKALYCEVSPGSSVLHAAEF